MLSQTAEYALRAMVHLASQAPDAQTTEQIANVTRVPQAYLAKVLQSLIRARLVNSQRGLGGGMTLAVRPEDVTLLRVVDAVDPIRRIRDCPLGQTAHANGLCSLHSRLDNAMAGIEEAFGSTTLAEVLATAPNPAVPLCQIVNTPAPS